MRALEPFGYFANHASALPGFGGASLGPDPRYFLHTFYEDVRPGRAVFHLRLDGAKASAGELTFRVHSYRPGTDGDVSLVASTRLRLDEFVPTQDDEQIRVAVRIAAIEGVQYALYGYFSEPSDLAAREVRVLLEELGCEDGDGPDDSTRPVSAFRPDPAQSERRQLVSRTRPTLTSLDSRDCTRDQLQRIGAPADFRLDGWRARVALTVLEGHDMLDAGANGLVRGPAPESLAQDLVSRDCAIACHAQTGHNWFDFVVSYDLEDDIGDAERRLEMLRDIVGQLRHGGLAMIFLAYDPRSPSLLGEHGAPNRNELGRWALYLTGAGHAVAPMAFAAPDERAQRPDGLTPFALVVRHG